MVRTNNVTLNGGGIGPSGTIAGFNCGIGEGLGSVPIFVITRSVSDDVSAVAQQAKAEAIHSFLLWRDGLLRRACRRARVRTTRWLAMTKDRLVEPNRHFAERAEIRSEKIPRLYRQRRMAGPCRDNASCFQGDAELA